MYYAINYMEDMLGQSQMTGVNIKVSLALKILVYFYLVYK